jgi:hypothetical protein
LLWVWQPEEFYAEGVVAVDAGWGKLTIAKTGPDFVH